MTSFSLMEFPSDDSTASFTCVRQEDNTLAFEWNGPEDGIVAVSQDLEEAPMFAELPWPLEKIGQHAQLSVGFYRRVSCQPLPPNLA